MNLFLFLSLLFISVFLLGRFLERFKVPWIFAALFLGIVFSSFDFNGSLTTNEFEFLAGLGMYFMLFLIGFEINPKNIFNQKKEVFLTSATIIFSETIIGALILNLLFGLDLFYSLIIALSFAAIGEVALFLILDEFKLVKTRLGQFALAVGMIADFFSIFAILLLTVSTSVSSEELLLSIISIFSLFAIVSLFTKYENPNQSLLKDTTFSAFLLLALAIFFLFLGLPSIEELSPLGAILAGVALKNFMPASIKELFEKEIKGIAYGFFGPVFFFSVGLITDLSVFIEFPLLIIGLTLAIKFIKILSTYVTTQHFFGPKNSLLLGFLFSVKLSTSIVVVKILYDFGIIDQNLFSILVAMKVWFKFFVPFIVGKIKGL